MSIDFVPLIDGPLDLEKHENMNITLRFCCRYYFNNTMFHAVMLDWTAYSHHLPFRSSFQNPFHRSQRMQMQGDECNALVVLRMKRKLKTEFHCDLFRHDVRKWTNPEN